jgi:beta-glucanase (GH16 family)
MDRKQRGTGRRFGCLLCCVFWAIASLSLPSRGLAQIADVPGYQLSWHDEFDVGENLSANWHLINLQNSFNNEKQYYLPSQDTLLNGNLRITADKPAQPVGGKTYISGRLESLATFPQGRFEARIDIPAGKGMWPAFWLNANAVPWPNGGEIDIMENKGSQPTVVSSAFHYQKDPSIPCCNAHQYQTLNNPNPTNINYQAGFHTYATEWDSVQIKFLVDGVQFFRVLYDPSIMSLANFNTAKNIILNAAVGGDFDGDPNASTTFPQYMDVDYVRVWTKQTGLLGDYNHDGVVDSGDYTVWRDTLGQDGIGLAADGSGNGTVDAADFTMWQTHFGATSAGSGAGSTAAVPEPTSVFLAAMGLMGLVWRARFCRR